MHSDVEDAESLRRRVLELSDAWRVYDKKDTREAELLADALVSLSRDRYESLVQKCQGRPVLVAHMCDGWASFVKATHTMRPHVKGPCVQRQTRKKEEFLLQRVIFRSRIGSQDVMHQMCMPPRPLTLGRGSWNMLQATHEALLTLRDLGHDGINILVFIQDGALHASTFRKVRGLQAMKYERENGIVSDEDIYILGNYEWLVGIQCKAHSCSLALSWGLFSETARDHLDDCHIVIQSLINTSTQFFCHMPTFVRTYVTFRGADDFLTRMSNCGGSSFKYQNR